METLYLQYQEIFKTVNPLTTTPKDSLLITIKKAAFVRNLEYNLQVNKKDETNFYFLMPFLRGLSEDYIALKFITQRIESIDQDDFIKYFMTNDLVKSINAQENFFDKVRVHQQIVIPKTVPSVYENHNISKEKIKELSIKYKWPNNKIPNLFELAKSVGLEEFYKYFYHSTSRIVHFNPQLLLRLGWGIEPGVSFAESTYKFSTENLEKYYAFFCKFYGWYIFSKLYEDLKKDFLEFNENIESAIAKIEAEFENLRWPELVTFEELNIPMAQGMMIYDEIKFGITRVGANSILGIYKNGA
jgi:hypothetical protein